MVQKQLKVQEYFKSKGYTLQLEIFRKTDFHQKMLPLICGFFIYKKPKSEDMYDQSVCFCDSNNLINLKIKKKLYFAITLYYRKQAKNQKTCETQKQQ